MAACLGKKKIEIEDTDATRTQPTPRYDPNNADENAKCLQKGLVMLCKILEKERKERENQGYKSKRLPGLKKQYKEMDTETIVETLHKLMQWECRSCTHLQDEAKWLKDELNESKRVNKDSDAQKQRKEDECKKATDENERLQRELQRLQEDDQTLKEKLETYTRENKNLSDQLQESDQTSKENHEMYTSEKKDLSDQLQNLQSVTNSQELTLNETLRKNQDLNERIQLLQGDVKRLRDNFSASERENQNLNEWIHRLKAEKETETKAKDDALLRIHRLKAEVETERKAKDDALLRLSAIASSRLRDNNPNITDLSDENRPTKLGEKMCELYDNEWTDAFDVLESEHDEFNCIQLLLQIFETAFVEISKKATKQMELVREAITWEDQDAKELIKSFKDMRKKKTGFFIIEHSPEIAKTVSEIVGSAAGSKPLQTYIDKSIECCWIMVVQDPPLCLHKSQLFERFDTKLYREYTARGPFLQFVVWPTVLLHKDGPILAKGVAQGGPAEEVNKDVDPQSRPAVEQAQGVAQGGPAKEVNEDDDPQSRPAEVKAQGVAQGGPAKEVNEDDDPQSRPAEEKAKGVAQGGPAKEVNEDDDPQSRPAEEKAQGVAQGRPAKEVKEDVDPQSRPAEENAQGVAQGGPAKEVKEDVDPQSRPAEEKAQTGDNQGDVNSNTENPSDVHNDDNKQADVDIKHTRNQGDVVNSNTDNLSDDDNDDNKQADFDI